MIDYGKLPHIPHKCKMWSVIHYRHRRHFEPGSLKYVDARKLNTIRQYDNKDLACVGVSKETGKWGIIEVKRCFGRYNEN